LNPPIKRLLAFAGSVVAGLAGVTVLASPAQAHTVDSEVSVVCKSDGTYLVKWTLLTKMTGDRNGKVTDLSITPDTPVRGIEVGSIIPANRSIDGFQIVPGTTKNVELNATVKWYNPGDNRPKWSDSTSIGKVLPGDCAPKPKCVMAENAQYRHTFNGPEGKATVELKGDLPLCEGETQDFLLVSYYAPGAKFGTPQYKYDSEVGTVDPTTRKVRLDVDLPPCWTQVDLVWGQALIDPLTANGPRYGDRKLGSNGVPGSRSQGPQGWYNGAGTEGRECTTPEAMFVPACDGTVEVHLSNDDADGKFAATFTVKATGFEKVVEVPAGQSKDVEVPANVGKITVIEQGKEIGSYTWKLPEGEECPPPSLVVESTCDNFILKVTNPEGNVPAEAKATYASQVQTKTVAAGATETFTFAAGNHTTATVTFTGLGLELVALYEKPANCDTLPVTGANTVTIIGTGTGIALLGGLVFFFARRRMVNLRKLAS
jgi:LPXTG-motif cell wall-anchored protein